MLKARDTIGQMESVEFLKIVAQEFGVDQPTDHEMDAVLKIASISAHSSERKMAPIVCWLSAKAGVSPKDALEIMSKIADDKQD